MHLILLANNFSYMPGKAFIRSIVVFSLTTLCKTDLNRINRITLNICLPRRFQSSSFIVLCFFSKKGDATSSHGDNLQYSKSVLSNFLIPKALSSSLAIASTQTYALISLVGSWIILPQILSIPNSNCTQEHNFLRWKPFLFEGKNQGKNFELIHNYQLNYNNSYVCLTVKEKSLLFFFTLTHTNFLS